MTNEIITGTGSENFDIEIGIASSNPKVVENPNLTKWDVSQSLDAFILKLHDESHSRPVYYFQSIATKKGNVIALDFFSYNYIELMNEFLSKNLHDDEEYSLIENGCGFLAKRGKTQGNIPILLVDIYNKHQVIETLKLRRYEIRVAVNKLKRLISHCSAMVS